MKKEHKVYDEEFKKTIVSLCESGKKKSDLTREYGISYTNISELEGLSRKMCKLLENFQNIELSRV